MCAIWNLLKRKRRPLTAKLGETCHPKARDSFCSHDGGESWSQSKPTPGIEGGTFWPDDLSPSGGHSHFRHRTRPCRQGASRSTHHQTRSMVTRGPQAPLLTPVREPLLRGVAAGSLSSPRYREPSIQMSTDAESRRIVVNDISANALIPHLRALAVQGPADAVQLAGTVANS